jgi:hypothetical protein
MSVLHWTVYACDVCGKQIEVGAEDRMIRVQIWNYVAPLNKELHFHLACGEGVVDYLERIRKTAGEAAGRT